MKREGSSRMVACSNRSVVVVVVKKIYCQIVVVFVKEREVKLIMNFTCLSESINLYILV